MTTVYKKSICEYDDEHEYELMDTVKKRKRGIRLSTGQTVLDVLRTCLVLYFVYFAELAMRLTSFPEEKIFPPDMLKVSHHFTYFCGIIGSLYIP